MSIRTSIAAAVFAAVSLATAISYAQGRSTPPQLSDRMILSGSDIGFRVEGRKGASVVGTLMVRINGEWVEAEFQGGVKRLTMK